MKRRRLFAAWLCAAALQLAGAGPAVAASYDLFTGPSPNGGYGEVSGTLSFTSNKRFEYSTYVDDKCPPDSLGVSFYFNLIMGDNSVQNTNVKGKDIRTCGAYPELFFYGEVTRTDKRIATVRVISCWTMDGNDCWTVDLDHGLSGYKDNPYTAG